MSQITQISRPRVGVTKYLRPSAPSADKSPSFLSRFWRRRPASGADTERFDRHLFGPLEVGLARRRTVDLLNAHDVFRCLISSEALLDEFFERLRIDAIAGDHGGDRFAPFFIGHADDHRILYSRVEFDHLLDLLGKHLLAA